MEPKLSFYKETNFRETPVGRISKEWRVAKLGQIAEINKESRDPSKESPNQEFLYIDIDSIEGGTGVIREPKRIIGKDAPSRARRVIHPNDVIMSTVRPYLKAFAMVPKEYGNQICSTGFAVFSSKEGTVPHYLLHTLFSRTVISQCNRMMVGGQYPALNTSQVAEIRIPFPPSREQQKIAEVLSTVDEAIQKTSEVIAKTERLKKGLMQELLTKGIGHKEFKDTEIGRIPNEWKVVRLGHAVTCKKGTRPKTLHNQKDRDTLPYLTADVIRSGVFTQWAKVTDECVKVGKDDIILIWDGFYCGDAFIGVEGILSSTMIEIEPNVSFDKHFLYYLLKTHFRELNTKISGMYLKHVSKSIFEGLKLPLPPLPEQQRIAEILSIVDKKVELERNEKARLERIKQGMMDLLLTGKIRIKV